jgi:hypothetical protein
VPVEAVDITVEAVVEVDVMIQEAVVVLATQIPLERLL